MKISDILVLALASPALGSLFFQDSRSDQIKAKLSSIGYDVLDTAGLVKDSVFDNLSKESIDEFLAAHGVYDAGNNFLEVAKQHKDWLIEDIKDYAEAGNDEAAKYLQKGKEFYAAKADDASKAAWKTWSDSKLKEFLDARGINVPQTSTRDQLMALVARSKHNSPINFSGPSGNFWFDGWTREELANKLRELDQSVEGTRKELSQRLYAAYISSYETGKVEGSKAAESLAQKLGEWKEATAESFNSWSVDDLKDYLQDFGAAVGETKDSLVQSAQNNYNYFVKGEVQPKGFVENIKYRFTTTGASLRSVVGRLLGGDFSVLHLDL